MRDLGGTLRRALEQDEVQARGQIELLMSVEGGAATTSLVLDVLNQQPPIRIVAAIMHSPKHQDNNKVCHN